MSTYKKIISYVILITLSVGLFSPSLLAAENQFQTSLTIVAEDNTAPTIPTGLVATAISSSQINLSWIASTDDTGVVGYRVFRDGVFLATSSSITYADTGLTQLTNYVYNVEAFDRVPRLSGLSAPATATTSEEVVITPTPTPTPPPGGGSGSGGLVLMIYGLSIVPDSNTADISFITNIASQTRISWGETKDYETASLFSPIYSNGHSVKITGLKKYTRYFVKIEAVGPIGQIATQEAMFNTYDSGVPVYPVNAIGFRAVPKENSIALSWDLPSGRDIDGVRIVRSDRFFPRDPSDGKVLTEGYMTSFDDTDVVVGTMYYYALFTKDSNGRYSSGALAQARIKKPGEIGVTPANPFGNIPIIGGVNPTIAKLSLDDFDFIQDGRVIIHEGNTVAIDGMKNLTVRLNYELVAESLKTIAFALTDPEDPTKVFSFLLRVNENKTAFEAVIAPLMKSGRYGLFVSVLDYKNQGLKRLEGNLRAFVFGGESGALKNFKGLDMFNIGFLLLLLLILIIWIVVDPVRRRKRSNVEVSA